MSNIYFFGDTHADHDIDKVFQPEYKEDDYIIICGDFGVIWSDLEGKYRQELAIEREHDLCIKLLRLPCTILFVDGNHENFNRINALKQVKMFGGIAGEYVENRIYHLRRGEIYNIANKNILTMGGALSIDKEYREPNISWWAREAIAEYDIQNAFKNIDKTDKIDIVVTHTCPQSFIRERLNGKIQVWHKSNDTNPYKLEKILNYLLDKNKTPKYWFFGHWHADLDFIYLGIQARAIYDYAIKLTESDKLEISDYSEFMYKVKKERRRAKYV